MHNTRDQLDWFWSAINLHSELRAALICDVDGEAAHDDLREVSVGKLFWQRLCVLGGDMS